MVTLLAAVVTAKQQPVFPNAHAHNDYEHTRPLLDALDAGFGSVEADVWLVNGRLLVAHDEDAVKTDRTLEALYLDPLQARIKQNGGRVYRGGPEFLLWIDIKSEAEATYSALRNVLDRYRDLLTVFTPDAIEPGAIRVIVSGKRPRQTMAGERVRLSAYDGRLADLSSGAAQSLIPIVSDNWEDLFNWRGVGPLPDDERAKLRTIVADAHRQQRQVRFWAVPDSRAGWRECLDAGVDLINTDDLDGLRRFLAARGLGR